MDPSTTAAAAAPASEGMPAPQQLAAPAPLPALTVAAGRPPSGGPIFSPASPDANEQFHDAEDGSRSGEANHLLAARSPPPPPPNAADVPAIKPVYVSPPACHAKAGKRKPGCLTILRRLCGGKRCCRKGRVGDASSAPGEAKGGKGGECEGREGDGKRKEGLFSKLSRPLKAQKSNRAVFPAAFKYKIVVLGIDNAGKSTFISRITRSSSEQVQTTWGFASHSVEWKDGVVLTLYDLGGHSRIRGIWVNYIAEVHAAIFVIDAADRARLPEAKQALHDIYGDARLFGKPLIIIANKQDSPGALSPVELYAALEVGNLKRLFPDLSGSRQELSRAAAAGEKPRGEILKEMVAVVGCKSLLHVDSCAAHEPDPSVDNALNQALARVRANIHELQPRIDKAVVLEEERFKREREEQLKRVEEFRRERKDEKEAIVIAETAAYPQAPMP